MPISLFRRFQIAAFSLVALLPMAVQAQDLRTLSNPNLIETPPAACLSPDGDTGQRWTNFAGEKYHYCAPGFSPTGISLKPTVNGVDGGNALCAYGSSGSDRCPSGFKREYIMNCCYQGG